MVKKYGTARKLAGWIIAVILAVGAGFLVLVFLWPSDPFRGAELYVNPYSSAGRQADEWRSKGQRTWRRWRG